MKEPKNEMNPGIDPDSGEYMCRENTKETGTDPESASPAETKADVTAIVLAAGNSTRMGKNKVKQFMNLCGKPVIIHTLQAFQENELIKDIILVVPQRFLQHAAQLCVKYRINKVHDIIEGGEKRYLSVYNGLKAVRSEADYVLIHDGARPLVTQDLINRCIRFALLYKSAVAAVPVTDTIKRGDARGFAEETINRSRLWAIQTPQVFSFPVIINAYVQLLQTLSDYKSDDSFITDDAVIVENMTDTKVRLVLGDFRNIKITNPYDMTIAEAFLKHE